VQALAARLWVGYGVIIHAAPVIVANLVVANVAAYSSFARPRIEAAASSEKASSCS
jgi:hypothetical protein